MTLLRPITPAALLAVVMAAPAKAQDGTPSLDCRKTATPIESSI